MTDLQGSIDPKTNRSLRTTRPIMCNSMFEGGSLAYLRHGTRPEEAPVVKDEPMLQPFWAAGLSFSRGHFVSRVPYDCCLPMVFQGEEISMGVRAWTHGYDHYAPIRSVVFHEYMVYSKRRQSHSVPLFWENKAAGSEQAKAQAYRRLVSVIGMTKTGTPSKDEDPSLYQPGGLLQYASRYGVGATRPVSLFYQLFMIDVVHHRSEKLCGFVRSASLHRLFQKHLRKDGRGIDVSSVNINEVHAQILSNRVDTIVGPLVDDKMLFGLEGNALVQARQLEESNVLVDPSVFLRHGDATYDCSNKSAVPLRIRGDNGSVNWRAKLVKHLAPSAGLIASFSKQKTAPTIFCAVFSTRETQGQAIALVRSWLARCDGATIFSRVPLGPLPVAKSLYKASSSPQWPQMRSVILRVRAAFRSRFDYFLFGTDRTYIMVPVLRAYLGSADLSSKQAANNSLFLGRRLAFEGNRARSFNSVSAGFVLNAKALDAAYAARYQAGCEPGLEMPGDLTLGDCLRLEGVVAIDTRDDAGAERFNPFPPDVHFAHQRTETDWYSRYSPDLRDGAEGCSRSAISFGELDADAIPELDGLVQQASCPRTPTTEQS